MLRSDLVPSASKEERIFLHFGGLFSLFFHEDVCGVFIFLHKILCSHYLYLVFFFSMVLLVEIPSQLFCICGTEENAGSSIDCALW